MQPASGVAAQRAQDSTRTTASPSWCAVKRLLSSAPGNIVIKYPQKNAPSRLCCCASSQPHSVAQGIIATETLMR